MPEPTDLLLLHGTSTAILGQILERGLVPTPPRRLSQTICEAKNGRKHAIAFPGVYVAADLDTGLSYTRMATERFGGEPLLVLARVPANALVPDEDEVHFQLTRILIDTFAPDDGTPAIARFEPDAIRACAATLAASLLSDFELWKTPAAPVAACLEDMLLATRERAGGRAPDTLFCTGAWSEPAWVGALTQDDEGLRLYRARMDELCRAMVGASPDAYPCGWEGCRGRVPAGIPLPTAATPGAAAIVAIGRPDALGAFLMEPSLFPGATIIDRRLQALLAPPRRLAA